MLKKMIRSIMLFSICLFASVISVNAETTESVMLDANGNTADIILVRPQTEGSDEILSLQLAVKIETKQGDAKQNKISFVFDDSITSTVKTFRYNEDTGILTLYISGSQNLYEKETLALGKVVLDSDAKEGVTASASVVEDSLKLVNAAFNMQETDLTVQESVELVVGSGGKENSGSSQKAETADSQKTEVVTDKRKAQNMKVSARKLTFTVGDKAKTLKVSKAKGKITYKSSDTKIVKVNSKGKVVPKSAGKATISINAAGNSSYKAETMKVSVVIKPKKPGQVSGLRVKTASQKGNLKVSWKKKSVTGYQIQYSYSKNMRTYTIIDVNKKNASAKTLKGLTSGKDVYVRVRAYKTENKVTNYGKWSKKVKTDSVIK